MKKLFIVVGMILSVSCAAKKLQNQEAQETIARQLDVPEQRIKISKISELSNTALVDTMFRATFVLQKDSGGKWRVVRMQHSTDRWETPEEFLKAASPSTSAFRNSLEDAFLAMLQEEQH
jgi:hypothetical protein